MSAHNIIRYLLLWSCVVICNAAHAANDKAFLWAVTAGDEAETTAAAKPAKAVVYLMGSIHFADKSFYPLRPEIEDAYQRSQYLVVELDVNRTDHQAYTRLLSQKGVLEDGRTIEDVISDETWLQLRQRLRHLNIDYEQVKNYKPGILVLTLSAAQVMQMGFDPELGLDAYFLARASRPESAKHIIELESLAQQFELFLQIPDGDLLLQESLYSLDEAELLMAEMVRYWKQGDEEQMSKLLFEDALEEYPAFSSIYDSLFYERNDDMTTQIEAILQQQTGHYFIVVGSGHLIGDRGIVEILRSRGYQVERL